MEVWFQNSVLKFKPQFIIVPCRMVRIQGLGPKDCSVDARIDLAMASSMGVLAQKCGDCCRNPLFQQVLKEIRDLPVLSNIMERLCPAIGVNPVPRVQDHSATILPTNAMRQSHNYRADVPIKAATATIVNTYIIPTMEVEYYTLQFGDAVDAKSETTGGATDKVVRDDAMIVEDKLFIIPPLDNAGVLEGWLKNVAELESLTHGNDSNYMDDACRHEDLPSPPR